MFLTMFFKTQNIGQTMLIAHPYVQECSCSKYKVYHTVYQNASVPKAVEYLSGTFVKVEDKKDTYGLLAPLYR